MVREEFEILMKKLAGYYSRTVSGDFINTWAEKFSYLDGEVFRRAINLIFENEKTFPSLGQVKGYVFEVRKTSKEEAEKINGCKECGGFGSISARQGNHFFVFRCECEAGNKFSKQIKVWTNHAVLEGFERVL